ncbi:hypothetical protein D3C85_1221250 [compost metagenome]
MAPSSSTSSISTVISLPTLRASLRTETCCCSSMKRWKRSSWTSSGTGSGSSLALAPSTGLYLKQSTLSSSSLSMKPLVLTTTSSASS